MGGRARLRHDLRSQLRTVALTGVRPPRQTSTERRQLDLFRAIPGELAARDAQDLMAWPFFSLAKSKRVTPIDFRMGDVTITVEATAEHGMATIWDADVQIGRAHV